jgi:hypothetical protein
MFDNGLYSISQTLYIHVIIDDLRLSVKVIYNEQKTLKIHSDSKYDISIYDISSFGSCCQSTF